ncbi:MAG: NAD(P)-dependent alcohol dehydrogenase [Proteobacteria bacterium]|nr:NAD(P)-dependent alcohol dehydrogenase [Pseudomonadota bacterium]
MTPHDTASRMTAWQVDPAGTRPGLRKLRLAVPIPAAGEVLVRLGAASLNYRDLLVSRGFYGATQRPVVAGSDGAGLIAAVGDGVDPARIGQRVAGAFFPDWTDGPVTAARRARSLGAQLDGVLAEYVVLPAQAAIPVPDHLSDSEAATLPCAGLTAWHAVTAAGLQPGMTLLLQGAGGVSVMALLFARMAGLRVLQTASTADKADRLRALGAEHVLASGAGSDWATEILALTGGLGADAVIDIGGPGSLALSARAVRVGGTIVSVGFAGDGPGLDIRQIVGRAITLRGITVGSCAMFADMNRAIAAARLRPVIHRRFSFDEVPEAYACLEAGGHVGKIVVEIADTEAGAASSADNKGSEP